MVLAVQVNSMQIKFFRGKLEENLEKSINKWLKDNYDKDIVNMVIGSDKIDNEIVNTVTIVYDDYEDDLVDAKILNSLNDTKNMLN